MKYIKHLENSKILMVWDDVKTPNSNPNQTSSEEHTPLPFWFISKQEKRKATTEEINTINPKQQKLSSENVTNYSNPMKSESDINLVDLSAIVPKEENMVCVYANNRYGIGGSRMLFTS